MVKFLASESPGRWVENRTNHLENINRMPALLGTSDNINPETLEDLKVRRNHPAPTELGYQAGNKGVC